jgi:hypothetical protein
MASEIAGAVQSIRLLWDFVKANKSLANYNELVAAVSEVNADLIAAQSATIASQKSELTLTELVRELKEKIVTLENWNREAERYQLGKFAPGVPAYTLKPGMENNEPPHPLCANCFDDHKKSFLRIGSASRQVSCTRCSGKWFSSDGTRASRLLDTTDDAFYDELGRPRY